jgi:hypothetical protein
MVVAAAAGAAVGTVTVAIGDAGAGAFSTFDGAKGTATLGAEGLGVAVNSADGSGGGNTLAACSVVKASGNGLAFNSLTS